MKLERKSRQVFRVQTCLQATPQSVGKPHNPIA
jgi:hypothetical protein